MSDSDYDSTLLARRGVSPGVCRRQLWFAMAISIPIWNQTFSATPPSSSAIAEHRTRSDLYYRYERHACARPAARPIAITFQNIWLLDAAISTAINQSGPDNVYAAHATAAAACEASHPPTTTDAIKNNDKVADNAATKFDDRRSCRWRMVLSHQ